MANRMCRSVGVVLGIAGMLALAAVARPAGGALSPRRDRPTMALQTHVLGSATGIAPGDRVERILELSYGGTGRLTAVMLVATARRSSRLDSDAQHGLRVSLERCSVRWTRRRNGRYRCTGRRWPVLAPGAVVGTHTLERLSLAPRHTDHLRLTLVLPARARNELQRRRSTLVYRFVGTAR